MDEVGDIPDRNQHQSTRANSHNYKRSLQGWTSWLLPAALPVGWFALTFLIARPLADGPVVDSWVYFLPVKSLRAGVMALPGFAAATPVAQIVYGTVWSRLFGFNYVSLDLAVATLGLAGAMMFYLLARRCGAGRLGASLGTTLLIANPCYLFLSFSFMTDVPFVAVLIAAYLAFAAAGPEWKLRWLWMCAALAVVGFLVRPFAITVIVGAPAAIVLALGRKPHSRVDLRLLPFIAALVAIGGLWWWLRATIPQPWMLQARMHMLRYVGLVTIPTYFVDGLLAPMLYLGMVLGPLAIPHLAGPRWRVGLLIAAGVAAIAIPAVTLHPGARSVPELSCCGGWNNALVLRGLPLKFFWSPPEQLAALTFGILGTAGTVLAALEVGAPTAGFLAVMIATALYWGGTIPLWLFNDRYYLPMVPAGCLLLAVAPLPRGVVPRAGAIILLGALGWLAIAGVYDQQRGLTAVMAARDTLMRQGVPRTAIDAGYPLNGNDLYRLVPPGVRETKAMEAEIPMLTTRRLAPFMIAGAPVPRTQVVKRFAWPGMLGFGRRSLYVLRKSNGAPASNGMSGAPPPTTSHARAGMALIMIRLAMLAMIMAVPLLASAAAFILPRECAKKIQPSDPTKSLQRKAGRRRRLRAMR